MGWDGTGWGDTGAVSIPLRSPMSPGAGEPGLGSSLEAIAEPLVEDKEDDDGVGELEER